MPRQPKPLLTLTPNGLYCPRGDFHIDPWNPVDRAVLTHAHADHARPGSKAYLAAADGAAVFRTRLGPDAVIETVGYGEKRTLNGVSVSLIPAGHILGSAQVRVAYRGRVWVVSGDYKTGKDPTCAPFEPVRCNAFISESTFALPIFSWPSQAQVFGEIDAWWQSNREQGRTSVLFVYALGKAQRVLAGIDATAGPILAHGAVLKLCESYRASGIALPELQYADEAAAKGTRGRALVLAPPSAAGTPWIRKFGEVSTGFASGWMRVRGIRRRRAVDRGFVLSDHCDWNTLVESIRATGADRVLVTHGYTAAFSRWLADNGWESEVLPTRFAAEPADPDETEITATHEAD